MSVAMRSYPNLKAKLAGLWTGSANTPHSGSILAMAAVIVAGSIGIAEAAAHAPDVRLARQGDVLAKLIPDPAPERLVTRERVVWEGADLDGDGQPDIANPTGQAPRETDAYGQGRFHASRDGGAREHEGVDYVATPGQAVEAPISGYISKIGFAYPDDQTLRYVEIDNPALHLTARVLYVDPQVAVGDSIAIGHPIGRAHSLQARYRGITDHVHLEVAERGRKVDAQTLIAERTVTDQVAAD